MDENMTLLIDPDTQDLVMDEAGSFVQMYGYDTVVQNVRHALLTWKEEFFADPEHGTDYDRIMTLNQNDIEDDEVKEIIRDAVFQEPAVVRIDDITVAFAKRTLTVTLTATMESGETFTLEVTA